MADLSSYEKLLGLIVQIIEKSSKFIEDHGIGAGITLLSFLIIIIVFGLIFIFYVPKVQAIKDILNFLRGNTNQIIDSHGHGNNINISENVTDDDDEDDVFLKTEAKPNEVHPSTNLLKQTDHVQNFETETKDKALITESDSDHKEDNTSTELRRRNKNLETSNVNIQGGSIGYVHSGPGSSEMKGDIVMGTQHKHVVSEK